MLTKKFRFFDRTLCLYPLCWVGDHEHGVAWYALYVFGFRVFVSGVIL